MMMAPCMSWIKKRPSATVSLECPGAWAKISESEVCPLACPSISGYSTKFFSNFTCFQLKTNTKETESTLKSAHHMLPPAEWFNVAHGAHAVRRQLEYSWRQIWVSGWILPHFDIKTNSVAWKLKKLPNIFPMTHCTALWTVQSVFRGGSQLPVTAATWWQGCLFK